MGFNIVKNAKVYLVYNRKLIIGSQGDLIIDFEEVIPRAYTIANDVLLVRDFAVASILRLSKVGSNYFDKPAGITSVSVKDFEITLTSDTQLSKDMVGVSLESGRVTVTIQPAVSSLASIPSGVSVFSNNYVVRIVFTTEAVNFSYEVRGTQLRILLVPKEARVEYTRKSERFNGYTFTVNYLVADPRFVDFVPLLPTKGIGSTAPLLSILTQNGVQHGVNGNYFDPNSGLPIDIAIAGGKVLSHRYGLRPVFIETSDDKVFIRKAYFDITVRINDVLFLVKGVNTPGPSEVNLYTPEYGLPIPRDSTKAFIVIRNNRVSSIEYTNYVPKEPDSYVVMMNKDLFNRFLSNLKPGAPFALDIQTDNNYRIKNAIGAGPLILQDGKVIPDAGEEKLRYGGGIPTVRTTRTLVAIKSDKVHLITIEGGNGMHFDDVAKFLLERGYEAAMMLDGGGSTSMVYNGRYVTSLTPRNIPIALGLR